VLGLIFVFPVRLSAWFHLGAWFLYQLLEANAGLWAADSSGDGVAFFAHVGGFVFGFVATLDLDAMGSSATEAGARQRRCRRPADSVAPVIRAR
jgi:membrane associated rhomboid family serine protease